MLWILDPLAVSGFARRPFFYPAQVADSLARSSKQAREKIAAGLEGPAAEVPRIVGMVHHLDDFKSAFGRDFQEPAQEVFQQRRGHGPDCEH